MGHSYNKHMPLPDDQLVKNNNLPPTPPVAIGQAVSSVGISKEKELGGLEDKILEEVRQGIEVEMGKEVQEAGLKEIKETIELPDKLIKETGAEVVGESVPVSTKPTLTLPLDEEQSKTVIKQNHDVVSSILWLAHWCVRQIKIAKLKLLGK